MKKYSYTFMDDAGQLFITIDSPYKTTSIAKRNIIHFHKEFIIGNLMLLNRDVKKQENPHRNTDNMFSTKCG